MATLAHDVTWYTARSWEDMFLSAVISGIVGDLAHRLRGGYHISIEDQPSTNYSVIRVDDKAPPGTWPRNLAAAIDMSMSPTDMATCSWRLWHVWNNLDDPRRIYINAFNGWFNDGGPAKRYDFVTQGISDTTSDHKWHVHLEIKRKWVTSTVAAMAILSILRGETLAQYLESLKSKGVVMFCQHGESNGQVWVLQAQINEVLTFMGVPANEQVPLDWAYTDKTAAGLMRIGVGNSANNGRVYGPGEYYALDKKLRSISAQTEGKPGPKGDKGDDGVTPTMGTIAVPATQVSVQFVTP